MPQNRSEIGAASQETLAFHWHSTFLAVTN